MTLFDLAGLKSKLEKINKETEQDGFWNDREKAQKLLKEKKSLENTIGGYEKLEAALDDIEVMIEMAEDSESGGDADSAAEMAETPEKMTPVTQTNQMISQKKQRS